MGQDMLSLKGISFAYNGRRILYDITMTLPERTFTVIAGPNGSGKTTLLRLMSGLLKADTGSVLLRGQDLMRYSARARARGIAHVPQELALEAAFSVEEIVLMGRYPHRKRFFSQTPQDLHIVREAMRLTEVTHLKDRMVTRLSGGERQRVLVARALAQQSEILLLDEPVANLDIRHQVELLALVRKLTEERGITVCCVLHDLNLSAVYADRMVLLHDGRLIAQGAPEQVLTPERVYEVYGMPMRKLQHPTLGKQVLVPEYDLLRQSFFNQ